MLLHAHNLTSHTLSLLHPLPHTLPLLHPPHPPSFTLSFTPSLYHTLPLHTIPPTLPPSHSLPHTLPTLPLSHPPHPPLPACTGPPGNDGSPPGPCVDCSHSPALLPRPQAEETAHQEVAMAGTRDGNGIINMGIGLSLWLPR